MSIRVWSVSFIVLVTLISMTMMAGPAIGHVPEFPRGNSSLDTAWEVHDPTRSWALYCTLPEGQVQYYGMNFEAGDRILLDLIIPVDEGRRGFLPMMALVGPGMPMIGNLPNEVEVPFGYGHIVGNSDMPTDPSFEPFSPGSYYQLAEMETTAGRSGQYYVVVWEGQDSPGVGGNYGFPVGFREEFTMEEMAFIPFSLLGVYGWEGQEQWAIFAPMVIAFVAIGLYAYWNRRTIFPHSCHLHYFETLAGAMIVGTGMMTLAQLAMVMTSTALDGLVLVTIFLIIIQSAIGLVLVRKGLSVNRDLNRWDRSALVVLGFIGLGIWAGYIVGPLLAIVGAFLPSKCDGGNPGDSRGSSK
jgi:hypothetical protein